MGGSAEEQVDMSLSLQSRPDSAGAEGERSRASESEGEESEVSMLREQISTLTRSMAALTEQKAEMEARFQADKKKAMVSWKQTWGCVTCLTQGIRIGSSGPARRAHTYLR